MKRKRILVSVFCALLSVLIVVTATAAPGSKNSAASNMGPAITKGGYSIFHETIVDMTWPEVEQAAKDGAIILFPTGVIEEHGPHMSLGVDTYGAYIRSKLIKNELEKRGIKAIIAPPFYWGINVGTAAFPGSFTSRASTVSAVIYDQLACLKRWGFNNVFFINHHGNRNHSLAIVDGIKEARLDTGVNAQYLLNSGDAKAWGIAQKEYILVPADPPPSPPSKYVDPHAGTGETSMMAYYFPEQVNFKMAKTLGDSKLTAEDFAIWRGSEEGCLKTAPLGYVGDPSKFDPKDGKNIYEAEAVRNANVIEACLKGTYKPPKS